VIRCIRLSSGDDGQSHVDVGVIELGNPGEAGPSRLSALIDASEISGVLDFVTRDGETFRLDPLTVLLAEDTVGGGHRWSIVGDQPWRRAYVRLGADAVVPFWPSQR
jgi:hypothetical protein